MSSTPLKVSLLSSPIKMDSDTESTMPSSTGNKHIDKCMKALKNNNPKAEALKPYLTVAQWIPLAINPYVNLTSVFFAGMEEDAKDEDLTQSSEMYIYAHYNIFASTKIAYSETEEEKRIFTDIMKLVLTASGKTLLP
ncbi:hypothetical protein BYT27DRAFT_7263217 [Phlegmacium glaucopus]|nr:hypothetical protein BYT27DRAFT_7263217 [Phlegmacium glaucopus]